MSAGLSSRRRRWSFQPRDYFTCRIVRGKHSAGLRVDRFSIAGRGIQRLLPVLVDCGGHFSAHYSFGYVWHHCTSYAVINI
jgi:hypothetical protein